jgi:hypothetical protein
MVLTETYSIGEVATDALRHPSVHGSDECRYRLSPIGKPVQCRGSVPRRRNRKLAAYLTSAHHGM